MTNVDESVNCLSHLLIYTPYEMGDMYNRCIIQYNLRHKTIILIRPFMFKYLFNILIIIVLFKIHWLWNVILFKYLREFQPMASGPDNSSLSSN